MKKKKLTPEQMVRRLRRVVADKSREVDILRAENGALNKAVESKGLLESEFMRKFASRMDVTCAAYEAAQKCLMDEYRDANDQMKKESAGDKRDVVLRYWEGRIDTARAVHQAMQAAIKKETKT